MATSLTAETYLASCREYELEIAVKPGTDMDSTFTAVCLATGETLRINGWLFTFEAI